MGVCRWDMVRWVVTGKGETGREREMREEKGKFEGKGENRSHNRKVGQGKTGKCQWKGTLIELLIIAHNNGK